MKNRLSQGRRTSPRESEGREINISLSKCPPGFGQLSRRGVRTALSQTGVVRGELAIAFVSPREMRRLHKEWMDEDSVTDVMTFDLSDGRAKPERVDGQLIVCPAVARSEARARGHSWHQELMLYIIHGCLHLCGYDDIRKTDARKMAVEQERILKLLTAK